MNDFEPERSSYLGHPMEVSKQHVRVFTPTGRKLGDVQSVSAARRLVRWNRRKERRGSMTLADLTAEVRTITGNDSLTVAFDTTPLIPEP